MQSLQRVQLRLRLRLLEARVPGFPSGYSRALHLHLHLDLLLLLLLLLLLRLGFPSGLHQLRQLQQLPLRLRLQCRAAFRSE